MGEDINNRVQNLIEHSGVTRNQFASKIGTSSAVISHIISGRNKPNIDLIYKIAEALPNVNIEWLLLGKGHMMLDNQKTLFEEPTKTKGTESEDYSSKDLEDALKTVSSNDTQADTQWDGFLYILEQMMESQRLNYKSMEQQMATQQEVIKLLKQMLKK